MSLGPVVLLLTLGTPNPNWPAPADATRADLADPAFMPSDPDYPPVQQDDECVGQLELYGFRPRCTPNLDPDEMQTGIAADRAWSLTRGIPEVVLAFLDDGTDLTAPDLVARYRLNAGELPIPQVDFGPRLHDRNQDGIFSVLDYTTATGTVPPTIDRIRDATLLSRSDRGDVNQNGILDPRDIITIFSNQIDEDENGYPDDIAGWDFLEDDNDPTASAESHGTRQMKRALATANNDLEGAGVCPECSGLALRVSAHGVADTERVAWALLYAAKQRASAAYVGPAVRAPSPFLEATTRAAWTSGVSVVAPAAAGPLGLEPISWANDLASVGQHRFDRAPNSSASTAEASDPCAPSFVRPKHRAPGTCEEDGAALAAGVLGLIESAARQTALLPSLTAEERTALLSTTESTDSTPRIDARAAIDALLADQIPPAIRWTAPAVHEVFDPSPGQPLIIEAEVQTHRPRTFSYEISLAPGRNPAPEELVPVASGEISNGRLSLEVSVDGLIADPTEPPIDVDTTALTLRLIIRSNEGPPTIRWRSIWLHRDLDSLPAFPISLGTGVATSPRLQDLDGDGAEEIIIATTDGALVVLNTRGQTQEIFPSTSTSSWIARHPEALEETELSAPTVGYLATPAVIPAARARLATVTTDGILRVLEADRPDPLATWRPNPVPSRLENAPEGASTSPAVWIDPDETVIVFTDGQANVHAARLEDPTVSLASQPLEAPGQALALGKPDPQESLHIVVTAQDHAHEFRLDDNLALLFDWPFELSAPLTSPRGPDRWIPTSPTWLTENDRSRIIVAGWGHRLQAFELDGNQSAISTERTASPAAFADLEEDGIWDALYTAATDPRFLRLGPSDELDIRLRTRPLEDDTGNTVQAVRLAKELRLPGTSDPLVVDVDGDARPELIVPDAEGRLWAVSPRRDTTRGWPKLTGDLVFGTPAAGDVDGDGLIDIVAVTRRGHVFVWRTPGLKSVAAPWVGARHDAQGTANVATPTLGSATQRTTDGCGCRSTSRPSTPMGWTALGLVILLAARRRQFFTKSLPNSRGLGSST